MAELDAVARLIFLTKGADDWAEAIERAKESGADLDKVVDGLQKTFAEVSRAADKAEKSIGDTGKSAQGAAKSVSKAAEGWDEYRAAIAAARDAQREFSQSKVAGQFGPDAIPALSAQQMTSQQRQNLLAANDADTASVISEARRIEAEAKKAQENLDALKQRSFAEQLKRIQKEDEAEREAFRSRVAEQEKLLALADERARKGIAAASGYLSAQTATRTSSAGAMSAWDKEFATALDEVNRKSEEFAAKSSPRLRYALYDVSTTALITAASISAVGISVGVMAANYESAFTNVERTLDGVDPAGVADLRDQLVGLTREIPLAFADVAQIATLGNQLGIASEDVATFTETVAQFSAVTGLTAEASAQAFGSLGELLNVNASSYGNLGSAIALVGRRSVATEQEIVAMTTRLAASATNAGFTAQQVVALSGAFASLRIAPERAQGVMEVYFNRLNTAISEGGESLDAFASVAGVTAGEVEGLVKSDPVGFFERLAVGLNSLDQVSQTRALQQLGLDGIRAGEVFGRVSSNLEVFNSALADSSQGWREGTELGKQYALVVDDLASRWQIFMNAVTEAGAAVGSVLAPAITATLDILAKLFQGFAAMAENPFGQALIIAAAAIGAMIAAISGLIAVSALGAGSLLAIRLAIVEFGWAAAGATAGVRGFIGGMIGMQAATGGAAVALRVFRVALISTGIGAAVVLVGTLVAAFVDFGVVMTELQQPIHFALDALLELTRGAMFAGRAIFQLLSLIPVVGEQFKGLAQVSDGYINSLTDIAKAMAHREFDSFVTDLNKARTATETTSDSAVDYGSELERLLDEYDSLTPAAEEATGATTDFGNAADTAAQQVRTLVDYASDLSGVFKRSFDIRFGGSQALDTVASAWNKIADENDAARKSILDYEEAIQSTKDKVAELQQELRNLAADRATKKYWLSIAELYGDALRAAQLREEIGTIDVKRNDTQNQITDEQRKAAEASAAIAAEQEKLNRGLNGNTDAAIANRAALLGLVGGYQEYLTALAASGASQETLQAEAARLKGEFVSQATAMGFSREEVGRYAAAFDDMSIIIANVPRNITVSANANPALQALNEFEARARAAAFNAQSALSGVRFPQLTPNLGAAEYAGAQTAAAFRQGIRNYINPGGGIQFITNTGARVASMQAFSTGGYTGNGSVNDVAGLVHGKEYVMSAPAVRNAGGPNAMAYLHQALKSGKGFMPAGGGAGTTRLDPADIDALARAISYYSKPSGITAGGIAKATALANSSTNSSRSY